MSYLDPAWVLSLMTLLEPSSPYRETFDRTALAIARGAERSPLPGQDAAKTAAVLVAVGWFESRFQPDAGGDCDRMTKDGICVKGSPAHSFCLFQVNETNLKAYGTDRETLLTDVNECVHVGLRMMHDSFRICRSKPLEERLSWYAAGRNGCDPGPEATKKSRHRMGRAVWLWSMHAPPQIANDDKN